jgi:hypothetical protein
MPVIAAKFRCAVLDADQGPAADAREHPLRHQLAAGFLALALLADAFFAGAFLAEAVLSAAPAVAFAGALVLA